MIVFGESIHLNKIGHIWVKYLCSGRKKVAPYTMLSVVILSGPSRPCIITLLWLKLTTRQTYIDIWWSIYTTYHVATDQILLWYM